MPRREPEPPCQPPQPQPISSNERLRRPAPARRNAAPPATRRFLDRYDGWSTVDHHAVSEDGVFGMKSGSIVGAELAQRTNNSPEHSIID